MTIKKVYYNLNYNLTFDDTLGFAYMNLYNQRLCKNKWYFDLFKETTVIFLNKRAIHK